MNGFKKVGKRIKYYREKQGIDKKFLAKCIGMSESKYEEIETGRTIYQFCTLQKIANALEIDLPELLDFE